MTVRIAPVAAEQIAAVHTWWRENRLVAPDLFDRELEHALDHVGRAPLASKLFERVDGVDARQVLLPRCRYALYFVIEEDVLIVALWHTARGSSPPLR